MISQDKNVVTKTLMAKIKSGDHAAYSQLFKLLWKPLYIRTFALLHDKQLAEDIVQDVWIDLWQRKEKIENDNIESYLFQAVRFRVYNHFRNNAKRSTILKSLKPLPTFSYSNPVEEVMHHKETKKVIDEAIESLPDKCKKVFKLSREEGIPNSEISSKMGISKKTVENHISNALKVIKKATAATISLLSVILF